MARVLLIDDSFSVRMMCKFTLEQAGHAVKVAENGIIGLQSAMDELFDVVITDINMPEIDGYKVCAQLRKTQAYKKRPILVLSSVDAEAAKPLAAASGVTDWISKPFHPERLIAKVNEAAGVSE